MKKAFRRLLLFALLLAAVIGVYVSSNPSYPAHEAALRPAPETVKTFEEGSTLFFIPDEPVAGLIFYPGGRVQREAYIPLMHRCAEAGILCALPRMPLDLAILRVNAADGVAAQFPQVEDWYIGGHSLGGAMAASYAAKNAGAYRGLILLAAYSTSDLRESGLRALSLYGSEDGVLNRASYEKNRGHLPVATTEIVLDGGCHAGFASYGPQDGDGTPTISAEEQIDETARAIIHFMAL